MTFEEFWQVYPKKTGKLQAQREWVRLKPNAEVCLQIAHALGWQVPRWAQEPRFTPNPSTWLHQGRWMDEPPILVPVTIRHVWVCPHVDPCGHRAMCDHKLAMPEKYPVKT
jgi:hypothetical protein